MQLEFTRHAADAIHHRKIEREWVERTVAAPRSREDDPNDPALERFFGPVGARQDRVLRVVVNTAADPWRVVTVFFDHKRSTVR